MAAAVATPQLGQLRPWREPPAATGFGTSREPRARKSARALWTGTVSRFSRSAGVPSSGRTGAGAAPGRLRRVTMSPVREAVELYLASSGPAVRGGECPCVVDRGDPKNQPFSKECV